MNRSALIDGIKALASQLIVLHHLSLYAPMTDWIAAVWPRLVQFLVDDGRYAVQPFLVIGGFLTAQSLARRRGQAPAPLIWKRYLRLVPQFLVALTLVVLATAWLGPDLAQEDWVSPLPTVGQFLAHLFFLQDVLGVPSLSAGAWYVAIDLQLFGLFAVLAHLAARSTKPLADSLAPPVVAVATVASIEVFSRQPAFDVWALYFLSAYGLGALAAWSRGSARAAVCWWLTAALLVADWWQDPRARPILALATALALYAGSQVGWRSVLDPARRWVEHLSDVSYSVFVCHFAVIVVASGLWTRLGLAGLGHAWLWTALTWAAAIALGTAVQRVCERWVPVLTRAPHRAKSA